MNLTAIIHATRARLGDEVPEYRWSTSQLTSWANEANIEACRRTRYLIDDTKTQAITAGTAQYLIPDGVIFIRRAILSGSDIPLIPSSYKEMDEGVSGWQTHTGTPSRIIADMNTTKYVLYPNPDANATLTFVAIVEPDELVDETDLPSRFGYGLIDWIMYRALQIPDLDSQNIQLSQFYLTEFEKEFGPRSSAKDEIFNSRNMPFDNYDGNY